MTREVPDLITALKAYSGQETEGLDGLPQVIADAISLPQNAALDEALFALFEKFPDEDGYGVYWTLVHALERRGGYEPSLLASVTRSPSAFAVSMLTRIANSGRMDCAGVPISALLTEVAASPDTPGSARAQAYAYLEHRE